MNYKVILDLPNDELYRIINNLRSEAIVQRRTETDEENREDLDCRIAGLDQMAYELATMDDITGEDRTWLLSLLNSSDYVHRLLMVDEEFEAFEFINPLEDEGFDKMEE